MKDVVVIVSGGMDSAVLAAYVKTVLPEGGKVHGLSFNYGQRHSKELTFAAKCPSLDFHREVNLQNLTPLLAGSSLTSGNIDVPEGHYAADSMKLTVVPNRNMIMLSIAVGYAVSKEIDGGVWFGAHAGDHFVYPDCRPKFVNAVNAAAILGNEGFAHFPQGAINAPFSDLSKDRIAAIGDSLHVDFSQTWSCYQGGEIHCGRCGTCVERKEAFRLARIVDPTDYEDPGYEIEAYRG